MVNLPHHSLTFYRKFILSYFCFREQVLPVLGLFHPFQEIISKRIPEARPINPPTINSSFWCLPSCFLDQAIKGMAMNSKMAGR